MLSSDCTMRISRGGINTHYIYANQYNWNNLKYVHNFNDANSFGHYYYWGQNDNGVPCPIRSITI